MNKKGQAVFLLLMLAISFFFIGLAISPAIQDSVDSGRSTMDCSNTSIDTSQKINCGVTDLIIPYTTAIIFAFAGALIGGLVQR